jgi:hypothetical protein
MDAWSQFEGPDDDFPLDNESPMHGDSNSQGAAMVQLTTAPAGLASTGDLFAGGTKSPSLMVSSLRTNILSFQSQFDPLAIQTKDANGQRDAIFAKDEEINWLQTLQERSQPLVPVLKRLAASTSARIRV